MEQVRCCFCNKELPNSIDRNNPEPLCHAYGTVCCLECDIAYVRPIRRLIWNPDVNEIESNLIADSLQGVSTKKLQEILSHKDPLKVLKRRIRWRCM